MFSSRRFQRHTNERAEVKSVERGREQSWLLHRTPPPPLIFRGSLATFTGIITALDLCYYYYWYGDVAVPIVPTLHSNVWGKHFRSLEWSLVRCTDLRIN